MVAVIPKEEEEEVVVNNLKQQGMEDVGTDGLFPKTGGCYGKDLAVLLLHRIYLSPLNNHHSLAAGPHRCGGGVMCYLFSLVVT